MDNPKKHKQRSLISKEKTRLTRLRKSEAVRAEYANNPTKCKHCSAVLPFEKKRNKYCNHSCATTSANQGRPRVRTHGEYIQKPCRHCEKMTWNRIFCSRKCDSDHHWKVTVEKIEDLGGLLPQGKCSWYGYNPDIAKKYLAEKRGRKCEICDLVEWMGQPIPLVLDHKSGNPDDHRLENVRLVCGNCNMLLPTFAGRNKGNGRAWRRKKQDNTIDSESTA